jgi:hypothetical protein
LAHKHQAELGFIAFSHVCDVVDERGLLMRLELHLNRGFGFAVLAEQHPAGGGLCWHLLDHAQAPPGRFQLQNKGTGGHYWIELDWHCVGSRFTAFVFCLTGGEGIQFFLLIDALFNANAEDYHEQQNYLNQDRRSVAGGFKRAARELHVIRKIKGTGMVHGIIVYCDCLLELF